MKYMHNQKGQPWSEDNHKATDKKATMPVAFNEGGVMDN